jgi:histidine triad (HIT) family protein
VSSVFTKIISGELPSYKIYEDDLVIAILALDQVNLGHTLVISKEETNHWFQVADEGYLQVSRIAKKLAPALKSATTCSRVGVIVAGFEVPHYHMHLIPSWSIADLSFSRAKKESVESMQKIQNKIIAELNSQQT